jgi:hypothetical protein
MQGSLGVQRRRGGVGHGGRRGGHGRAAPAPGGDGAPRHDDHRRPGLAVLRATPGGPSPDPPSALLTLPRRSPCQWALFFSLPVTTSELCLAAGTPPGGGIPPASQFFQPSPPDVPESSQRRFSIPAQHPTWSAYTMLCTTYFHCLASLLKKVHFIILNKFLNRAEIESFPRSVISTFLSPKILSFKYEKFLF